MTTPPTDDFIDLTAFALGELDAAEAARVKQYLASSPAARAEYVRIEHALAALKRGSSLPSLALTKRQRETILAVGQGPPRAKVIAMPTRPVPSKPSPAWSLVKFAAAACVTFAAFHLGQRMSPAPRQVVVEPSAPDKAVPIEQVAPAVAEPVRKPAKEGLANISAPEIKIPQRTEPKIHLTPAPKPALIAATAEPPKKETSQPVVTAAPKTATLAPGSVRGFTTVATRPEATLLFQPKLVKAVPHVFADKVLFAAPLPLGTKSAPTEPRRKVTVPPLVIHSSHAEIASCPWDSSRRLMRLIVQIPVDQAAVEAADADYKLTVKFDPFQVQGYRLVAEKHVAPSNGGVLATRFAWYEIVPTKNFSPTRDRPVSVGTFEVAHLKTARDSSPSRLLDRGTSWNDEREDYVFETAMIGFSLLLKGTDNVGQLDHKLVLEIAEQAKGEDPKGERAKFIGAVRQARRAAGL